MKCKRCKGTGEEKYPNKDGLSCLDCNGWQEIEEEEWKKENFRQQY